MVSIGTTSLPGASATVESAFAASVNVDSPGDVGIVGGADPTASANANEVYRVTSPLRARSLFGEDSALAQNVVDVLTSGTFPVYAAAAEEVDVSDEDISGIGSTSGTLSEGPGKETADAATFTVDGTTFTTIVTYEDPSTKSPASEEVYWNPTSQAFELGTAPASSGSVDYTYHDYSTALDSVRTEYGGIIDFLGAISEYPGVRDAVQTQVTTMESQKEFAIGVAGAASTVPDTGQYSNPYDDSRMQLLYPSRNAAGESIVGSYLGIRGAIGIERSAMKTVIRNQDDLLHTLKESQKVDMDEAHVVVLANDREGPMVENDPTCVSDSNTEESQMRDGLSRMLIDYVTDIVLRKSGAFVGQYHNQSTRNQLRKVLRARMAQLRDAGAVIDFVVHVEEIDAYTAKVELGVDTAQPLRNVVADITGGEVDTGAVAVSA